MPNETKNYGTVITTAGAALIAKCILNGGKVNIREGNGLTYGRITQLAPGTTCPYVATAGNGWHAVAVGKRVGWVSPEYSRVI